MVYAQINDENICIGVSQLSGEVALDSMIQLETYDEKVLGKKYTNGIWEDISIEPVIPQPIPQPTETEILMQTLADSELRSVEEQKDRQLLAQQISDLELVILKGGI